MTHAPSNKESPEHSARAERTGFCVFRKKAITTDSQMKNDPWESVQPVAVLLHERRMT